MLIIYVYSLCVLELTGVIAYECITFLDEIQFQTCVITIITAASPCSYDYASVPRRIHSM